MERWLELFVTVAVAAFASSGFWAWMQSRREKKDAKTQMILGLGHDRIMFLGEKYINRGWITSSEYEDLEKYLYVPYLKMGGNGTAEKLMQDIKKLPIRKQVS